MAKKAILSFYDATWIATVNAILEKWDTEDAVNYGDLGELIYGKKVGTAFAQGLFEMDQRVERYNRKHKAKLPYLNAMVVNAQTNVALGAPKRPKQISSPENVWPILKRNGKKWLVELSDLLGYPISGYYTIPRSGKAKKLEIKVENVHLISQPTSVGKMSDHIFGELGTNVEHFRADSWVIPAHHEAAIAVKLYLQNNSATSLPCLNVRPDFFVFFKGKRSIFEVKPKLSIQALATGIGQLLLYGKALDAEAIYLALPDAEVGSKLFDSTSFKAVLKDTNICIVPLIEQPDGKYKVGRLWRVTRTVKPS